MPITLKQTATALAVLMALFHIVAASPMVLLPDLILRGTHLLLALVIGYLIYGMEGSRLRKTVDAALIALSVVCVGYLVVNHAAIVVRPPWTRAATPMELFVAFGTILVVLELTRRALGMAISLLCIIFILYGFFGPDLRHVSFLRPLAHSGVNINEFVDQMYFSFEGIFGVALGVSTNFIFLFVVFGALLQVIGGGDFFVNVTKAATGSTRGGPAKMAVVASALMGTMSGSSVANVATTGAITIPMMKKLGYPKNFAGAVEAVASTGGQITPPIMGAAAFLMAAILGISYQEVITAAVLPAVLFFVSLFVAVHWEALKHGLQPLERSVKGTTWREFKAGWTFLLPLVVIMTFLMMGYTPSLSAFYGVVATLATPFLRRSTFVSPAVLAQGLNLGARAAVTVAVACASAGIIVGIVQISGLGFRFSSLVVSFANGNLYTALALAMIAAFIFGMGMPTTPAYIIQATLVAPALVNLGADPLAAHLFVFYYAVLGQITPPVAVAAFAAAPIADTSASSVGWRAFALGIPAYVIPFLFVANPVLLGQGEWLELILVLTRSLVAIICLSIMLTGWLGGRTLAWTSRGLLLVAAALLITPTLMLNAVAAVGILGVWALQKYGPGAVALQGETRGNS
ncbi:TRAP transporter permease [Pararhodobacter oceanensis]|uniref:C4-dicarboxylate ABC transporter permease n=1 Tax=Pararhodobacter oceanensis TaxID=2172121 RepID=A0A2T8HRR3_9RHOB|nr:TRAP transporter fused permease subunit [Pararhodobacter oceanensis]PVH28114.1 C4-dicarboxylate ABC transporter permease [Pararhodobacter oceanensis]